MSKQEIADMLYWFFTTGTFQSKPAWQTIAEDLKRLIADKDPKPIMYLNQYEIDKWKNQANPNNSRKS